MKFTFVVSALALVMSVDAQAAKKPAAKPAAKAPAAAKKPAQKPAAKKHRKVHSKKYNDLTPDDDRSSIRQGIIAWNDDNSKYRQKPPALPKSFGLKMKPFVGKYTHHRVIEKEASKKTGRIPQFPHDITRTSHRATFFRSDPDRRAINVQEACAGYSNEKERTACSKRYGVYTEKIHHRHRQLIKEARERCDRIAQPNRRRMCHNSILRKGTIPYFAQNDEENEDEEENQEAIDANEEDNSDEEENEATGLMQVGQGQEGDDDDDSDDDEDDLMQIKEDDDEDDQDEDEEEDKDLMQVKDEGDDDDDSDDDDE